MTGLLATGFIADNIGIVNAFILSGSAVSIMGLSALLVPTVRNMIKMENMSYRNSKERN
jgi:DHA3 family macrolide efflux protein-like MFS transporter